ncbi:NAD(P)-dependent dehydrogenase (short-subunit alcohol dehydrogenase family) [Mycobacteroides chelonae]|nr:NAD(P)-dependent dehydrogenase (short-subunit alcohol dehydrogenase family) [Mycobacteroides chelonae]
MNGNSSLRQGKSVIVTGGAGGLGAAFAHLDVTDVEQWQGLVATTIAEFGSITGGISPRNHVGARGVLGERPPG